MLQVLHVIQFLSLGGAARAMIAAAKYSRQQGQYQHAVVVLNGLEERARAFAESEGLPVHTPRNSAELMAVLATADIVQVNWWNCPELAELFRCNTLPPMRLVTWCHVGSSAAPQLVLPELVEFADFTVACSPITYQCNAIQALSAEQRSAKTAMAYGAADFARLAGIQPKPHTGFNVGYIGTLHFLKMHRDFVRMCAAVRVPEARFLVCGGGGAEDTLRAEAEAAGITPRFELLGYVENIRSVLETLDVYGYPLCPETYAGSELNLQEVMFAGIPAVVFPYGGVKYLVEHNETALVVNSAEEYSQAIEFLYHNPHERQRIGNNARRYAQQVFGAENAARVLNGVYQKVMQLPKRNRQWGACSSHLTAPLRLGDLIDIPASSAANMFVESLGDEGRNFIISMTCNDPDQLLAAEEQIARSSELMRSGGIMPFRRFYQDDPYLRLWAGLTNMGADQMAQATIEFAQALELGLTHWRVAWYCACAAHQCGRDDIALQCAQQVLREVPHYGAAQRLVQRLGTVAAPAG